MDKRMTLQGVVASLEDGMIVGFGGWGARRKPMALVREILRSDLKDLTIVSYGGPDVGMLCAAGKARKLIYGFVSLDTIPIEPYFRKAREAGAVEVNEYDEGMLLLGLQAAGWRIPFLPTRVGLGSDVMTYNKHLKTIRSPYADAETLVAMPALPLDVALIHVSRADALGNTQTDGPDPYIDPLFARAAARTYVTAEEVVERIDFAHSAEAKSNLFERSLVTGVVHAPHGAHPTASHDRYGWDIDHLKRYVRSASEEGGWESYVSGVIGSNEDAYLANVGGASHVDRLPLPVL